MAFHCNHCAAALDLMQGGKVGRRDDCAECGADLHCCYNCTFYDASTYNECREPQAERVLDKDRSNFCDYFKFQEGPGTTSRKGRAQKEESLKKLDDLFN